MWCSRQESSKADWGRSMKSPERHVQDFGLYHLGTSSYRRCLCWKWKHVGICFRIINLVCGDIKKKDVFLKAGRQVRSLLPKPSEGERLKSRK